LEQKTASNLGKQRVEAILARALIGNTISGNGETPLFPGVIVGGEGTVPVQRFQVTYSMTKITASTS